MSYHSHLSITLLLLKKPYSSFQGISNVRNKYFCLPCFWCNNDNVVPNKEFSKQSFELCTIWLIWVFRRPRKAIFLVLLLPYLVHYPATISFLEWSIICFDHVADDETPQDHEGPFARDCATQGVQCSLPSYYAACTYSCANARLSGAKFDMRWASQMPHATYMLYLMRI